MFDTIWWLTFFLLLVGCWLQTAIGFGMAVVVAPVVVALRPEWVPYVMTFTAMIQSSINAWHHRHHIHLGELLPAFITRIPGTLIGVWLLTVVTAVWLHVWVSLCVLAAVGVSLFSAKFETTPARMGWAGLVSGFMGTTTSIGGPPMALVMQHGKPEVVRANLSLYFFYSCTISLAGYAVAGLFDRELLLTCLSFVPAAVLGFVLGKPLHGCIPKELFRKLLLWLCAIAGSIALIGAVIRLVY